MPVHCPKCGYSNDLEFRFCGMCGAPLGRKPEEPARQKAVPAPPPPPAPEKKTPRPSPLPSFSVMADDGEDDVWPSDDTPRKTAPLPRVDDSLFSRRENIAKPADDTGFVAWDRAAKSKSEDISYPLKESYKKPKEEYSAVSGPSFLGLDPAPSSESAPQYLLEDDEPRGHGRLFVGILLLLAVGGGLFWQWQREGYPWNPSPKQSASSYFSAWGCARTSPIDAGFNVRRNPGSAFINPQRVGSSTRCDDARKQDYLSA